VTLYGDVESPVGSRDRKRETRRPDTDDYHVGFVLLGWHAPTECVVAQKSQPGRPNRPTPVEGND
jgi:hypothetical protein